MPLFGKLYNKILDHFGIVQKKNFFYVLVLFTIFSILSSFVPTFLNLDIFHLKVFSKDLTSIDFAMPYVGSFLGSLLFPYFTRSFSLRKIVIFSLFLLGLGYSLMIVVLKTDYNLGLRFFFGILYAFIFLALYIYQGKIFDNRFRVSLFLFAGLLSGLASSFGSLLNDLVYQNVFVWALAFFLILSSIFISFKIEDKQEKGKTVPLKKAPSKKVSFGEIIKQNPIVFIIIFIGYVTFYGFPTYYPFFGEKLGLSQGKAAEFLASAQFWGLFLLPLSGRLGDKYGFEKSIFIIILISLGMVLGSFLTENVSVISILFSISNGGMLSFYTLVTAWIISLYARYNLAKGLSFFYLIGQTGAIISPLGMGMVMQYFGEKGFIVWFFTGMALILSLLFIKMVFYKKNLVS